MGFLGFFNRGYREHDYLWGRLNGADRIVSFLTAAAENELAHADKQSAQRQEPPFSADATRIALYEKILQRERTRLHECPDTINQISALVKRLQLQLSDI